MDLKDRIASRLQGMEILEGVLPTRVGRSANLAGAALEFRANDILGATRSSNADLRETFPGAESAAPMFSGSSALRDQIAGFAAVGINLFHASRDMLTMSLAERQQRGASGSVSRVLVSDQRILLETPRIIVRFKADTPPEARAAALKKHGLIALDQPGLPADTMKVAIVDRGEAVVRSIQLMDAPSVVYAEPDFVEHIGHRHTPSDPDFVGQWHHAKILCDSAWDLSRGAGVSLAVIDNGFDIAHGDLVFGPLSGWFQTSSDHADATFIPGTAGMPDHNHGTQCAGMIAAREGNDLGGCGVAFGATLNMIACSGDQVGTQSTMATALAYAASPQLANPAAPSQGADIIVSSLGPNGAQWQIRQVTSDAIDYAATQGRNGKGCAIFWACTNGNFPIGADEVCSHAHVIAVGRSRPDDHDDSSGFGPQLEFLAPGVGVLMPRSGGSRYAIDTGTSFAAPCAAAVAALALSRHPNLTAMQVRQLMRDSCDKTGNIPYNEGRNPRYGYGRVNARRAVDEAIRLASPATPVAVATAPSVTAGVRKPPQIKVAALKPAKPKKG